MVFKWKNQHGKVERFRVVSEIFNKWQEIVYFDTNKLAVIGGYADPCGRIQQGSTFVVNEYFNDGSGWTNEFHVFDIVKGEVVSKYRLAPLTIS